MVSTGGCKTSYRETTKQSFEKNLDSIRNGALHLIEFNPKAIYCIDKPPVEAFVPLVSEVSGFSWSQSDTFWIKFRPNRLHLEVSERIIQ